MNASRTLEQLEGDAWPPASSDASAMVLRCHALRKMPLGKLSPSDCRLLIAQDGGTKHLVPIALSFIETQPLLEGDYYPGDVLFCLLGVSRAYWAEHSDEHGRLLEVARRASEQLAQVADASGSERRLLKDINAYLAQNDA